MKAIPIIVCLLLSLLLSPASTKAAFVEAKTNTGTVQASEKASQLMAQIRTLVSLSRKEVEQFTGHHLSLVQRIGLKLTQHRLRKKIQQAEAVSTLHQYISTHATKPKDGKAVRIGLAVILLILLATLIVIFALFSKLK